MMGKESALVTTAPLVAAAPPVPPRPVSAAGVRGRR